MTDVSARADALRELIGGGNLPSDAAGIEALLSCCEDLVYVGEAPVAQSLLEGASKTFPALPAGTTARIEVVRARVLSEVRKEHEALGVIDALLRSNRVSNVLSTEDELQVRICECKCLWRLNRAEEAVRKATALRRELLTGPDSALLANCNLQLSSAHMTRGDLRTARRFCQEAIVSAYRSEQPAIEAEALANLAMLDEWTAVGRAATRQRLTPSPYGSINMRP
jgi:hypothetical protein